MNDSPLVSIVCTAYNQEKYIRDALNGFVMQQTNFPFEIIVHDDASTDRTVEIIKEYEHKYSGLFFNIYQEINQYSKGNGDVGKIVYAALRGKYIAICEGDDYWTDPFKLQKQVDFLEENKNINLCFHQVNYVGIDNQILGYPQYQFDKDKSQLLSYEYLIENWCINTCSVVFRKSFENLPSFFNNYKVGDQPLFYIINMDKCFYYIHDVMASYRITNLGTTGTFVKNELKSDIEFPFLDKINELSKHKYSDIIQRRKSRTVIRDLKFMKNSDKYTFLNRCEFYFKHFFYLFNSKNGIKVSIDSLFKYVI